jgi:hypothetical protein
VSRISKVSPGAFVAQGFRSTEAAGAEKRCLALPFYEQRAISSTHAVQASFDAIVPRGSRLICFGDPSKPLRVRQGVERQRFAQCRIGGTDQVSVAKIVAACIKGLLDDPHRRRPAKIAGTCFLVSLPALYRSAIF